MKQDLFEVFHFDNDHEFALKAVLISKIALAELLKQDIDRLTIILDNPTTVENLVSVSSEKEEGKKRKKTFDFSVVDTDCPVTISVTSVNSRETVIPIAMLRPGTLRDFLTQRGFELIHNLIPTQMKISNKPGSVYLICNSGNCGDLWNVHSDPQAKKIHFVISACDEEFLWYSGDNLISSIEMKKSHAYLVDVQQEHTVRVRGYYDNQPRVHLVADLEYKSADEI